MEEGLSLDHLQLDHAADLCRILVRLKTVADDFCRAIVGILGEFRIHLLKNTTPKWKDLLGQHALLILELLDIVDEMMKISNACVHPMDRNAENSTSTPESAVDKKMMKKLLLQGLRNPHVTVQIEILKTAMNMISSGCDLAKEEMYDIHRRYGSPLPPDPTISAKIQERENLLRAAFNHVEGSRGYSDQKQIRPIPPRNIQNVLNAGDGRQDLIDRLAMYQRSLPDLSGNMDDRSTSSQVPYTHAADEILSRIGDFPFPSPQIHSKSAATTRSQSLFPRRMQFGSSGINPRRTQPSRILHDPAMPNDLLSNVGGASDDMGEQLSPETLQAMMDALRINPWLSHVPASCRRRQSPHSDE